MSLLKAEYLLGLIRCVITSECWAHRQACILAKTLRVQAGTRANQDKHLATLLLDVERGAVDAEVACVDGLPILRPRQAQHLARYQQPRTNASFSTCRLNAGCYAHPDKDLPAVLPAESVCKPGGRWGR